MKLCGSISECEAAAKGRLARLVGGDRAFSGSSPAEFDAGGTGGASGEGLLKYLKYHLL